MGRHRHAPGVAVAVTPLPADRCAAILRLYEELVAVMAAANNTLLARLATAEGTTDAHVDVLNEWSAVNNQLHEAHAKELARLTAPVADPRQTLN